MPTYPNLAPSRRGALVTPPRLRERWLAAVAVVHGRGTELRSAAASQPACCPA